MRSAPPDERPVLTSSPPGGPFDAPVQPAETNGSQVGPSLHDVRARIESRVRDLGASLFDRLVSEALDGDTSGGHPPK